MAYQHTVIVREVPTRGVPLVQADTALPFVVGLAPVHMIDNPESRLNKPILCNTFDDFASNFGYWAPESGMNPFGLCEFANVYFNLYGGTPAVFVAVSPASTAAASQSGTIAANGKAEFSFSGGPLLSTVVVKNSAGSTTYVLGEDYTLELSAYNKLNVVVVPGGDIEVSDTVAVTASILPYASATPAQVVAGVNLIDKVPTKFGRIPGLIVSPGFSNNETVALAMQAKAEGYAGKRFRAFALLDAPHSSSNDTDDVQNVLLWKTASGYSSPSAAVLWPAVRSGESIHWMSSHYAGAVARTDTTLGGNTPYWSASNQPVRFTGLLVNVAGTYEDLDIDYVEAEALNGKGMITGLNRNGTWVHFGSGTAAFEGTTDPKDSWVPIKRVMTWIGNSLFTSYFSKLDAPLNLPRIQDIADSANSFVSSLVAQGALNGGRVEFLRSDNPDSALMEGKVVFRVMITPPPPLQVIEFRLEYDASYLSTLFA